MLHDAGNGGEAHLLETDGSSLLAEALTAKVKAVLADKTSLVGTETAKTHQLAVLLMVLV